MTHNPHSGRSRQPTPRGYVSDCSTKNTEMTTLPQAEDGGKDAVTANPYRSYFKRSISTSRLPPELSKVANANLWKFLNLVKERGKESKVKENLKNDPTLATVISSQGASALEEAVKTGKEMVVVFLEQTPPENRMEMTDHAILYAIKHDNITMLEFLLHKLTEFRNVTCFTTTSRTNRDTTIAVGENLFPNQAMTGKQKAGWFEDAQYAPYVTPIALAVRLERLEAIRVLLEHGASEIHPLTVTSCPIQPRHCYICNERNHAESELIIEDSKRFLEIYRTLSSPAYIFESGVEDPVLEAFCLSSKMHHMEKEDPSFKDEYKAIGKKCRLFATELLDLCRTTSEVEILLKKDAGVKQINTEGYDTQYPRVLVSLYHKQIEFLAHPCTQQVLQRSWYSGLPKCFIKGQFFYIKLLIYWLIWIFFWPIGSILYTLRLKHVVPIMEKPITKYITNTLSNLMFLILIILSVILHEEKHQYFAPQEWVLIIYLIGMTNRNIKLLWRKRRCCTDKCKLFFSHSSQVNRNISWFDLIMLTSFWLWVLLQCAGFILNAAYKEVTPRMRWHSSHPTLVSEAFFALGALLSFIRLTALLKGSRSLGPLQISLTYMIWDTIRFFIIFIIVLTGFAIGASSIYSHYMGSVQIVNGEVIRQQNNNFISIRNSYKTFFWDIFGFGALEDANIVLNYTTTSNKSSEAEVLPQHNFTETFGYFLVAAYYIVAIVILLNMFIAMLATSYSYIQENADNAWKFARVGLWMTYNTEVGAVSPPFNIVPSEFLAFLWKHLCGKHAKLFVSFPYIAETQDIDIYMELMDKLNKRYWNKQKKEERGNL